MVDLKAKLCAIFLLVKSNLLLSRSVFVILTILFTQGCATKPKVFNLISTQQASQIVFPAPPEKARYKYLGDLIGGVNFVEEDEQQDGFWHKVLNVLTGIERERDLQLMLRPVNGLTLNNANILVADAGRQAIYQFDVNLNRLDIWKHVTPAEPFINPVGMTIGPNNNIFIADAGHGEVFLFDPTGQLINRFGKGILTRPTGIVYHTETDRVYVTDTQKHEIAIFNSNGEYLDHLGDRGHGEQGLLFNFPTFLALSGTTIYVTDTMNARVVAMDLEGKLLNVFGSRGYNLGDLNRPKGIAVDSQGHLYVVESYFDYLLVFEKDSQLLLPIGGTGNNAGQFYLPSGVWIDKNDRIYVADMSNGRVSIFQYLGEGE